MGNGGRRWDSGGHKESKKKLINFNDHDPLIGTKITLLLYNKL